MYNISNLQLQVRHENCWGRPRCVCAVAARSGQDVFTINACNSRQYINFPICNENSLEVIKETDKVYMVNEGLCLQTVVEFNYVFIFFTFSEVLRVLLKRARWSLPF